MKGYLLVRAEGKAYGFPVNRVLEVGDATEVLSIPRKLPAIRGLTPLRGRLVPLIHLGAFLAGREAPPLLPAAPSGTRTVVLVELGTSGRQVAFEVDDADSVVREQPLLSRAGRRCRGQRVSRRRRGGSWSRSSTWTPSETGSDDDDRNYW